MKYSHAIENCQEKTVTAGSSTVSDNISGFGKSITIPTAYRKAGIILKGTVKTTRTSSVITAHSAELYVGLTDSDSANIEVCKCYAGNNGYGTESGTTTAINCTGKSTIYTRVYGSLTATFQSGGSVSQWGAHKVEIEIITPWGIETETYITAGKVNEIASALGVSSVSATAGSKIIRTPYQTLASRKSLSMDSTKPLASDLQSLAEAAGENIVGSWKT